MLRDSEQSVFGLLESRLRAFGGDFPDDRGINCLGRRFTAARPVPLGGGRFDL